MRTLEIQGGTAKSQRLLEESGSKAGALRHLKDQGLGEYLPDENVVVEPGESIAKAVSSLSDACKYIVRLGHAHDTVGLVDVLPTDDGNKKGIERGAMEESADQLLATVESDEVQSYIEYELGRRLTRNQIHVLLQTYHGPFGGSILESPRGIYRIEYRRPEQLAGAGVEEFVFNDDGLPLDLTEIKSKIRSSDSMPSLEELSSMSTTVHQFDLRSKAGKTINRALDLYKRVRESKLFPEDMAFQMEYGVDREADGRILFYQARLFSKFQDILSFKPSKGGYEGFPVMSRPFAVYGTTEESGIITKIGDLSEYDVREYAEEERMGYIQSGHRGRKTGLEVQPRNVSVYHPLDAELLGHHHYRIMQKADVTIAQAIQVLLGPTLKKDDCVRVCSNGIIGAVQKI